MDKEETQTLMGTREAMQGNLLVLREYARQVVVGEDNELSSLQDLMGDLMRDYFAQGKSLKLTERDLVVLLYKDIL